jgi:hypothetical protein
MRTAIEETYGQLITDANQGFSMLLPFEWVSADQTVSNNVFFFGENQTEVNNRVTFWTRDDTQLVGGNGGLIASFEELGLAGVNLDKSVAANLDNFIELLELDVIEKTQPIEISGYESAYAVIEWGSQRGYMSLIHLPSEGWVIIFASNTPLEFDNNREVLFKTMRSVSVPAITSMANLVSLREKVVGIAESDFTFTLPGDWVVHNEREGIEQRFYFASTFSEINVMTSLQRPTSAAGAIIIRNQNASRQSIENLFNAYAPAVRLDFVETYTQEINGYEALWGEFIEDGTRGYWVVMNLEARVAVIILRTDPARWQNDQPILESIFRSLKDTTQE